VRRQAQRDAAFTDGPFPPAAQARAPSPPAPYTDLVDSDHENSCKTDGMAFGLKACFVKKA
jgi:hypothetical protein